LFFLKNQVAEFFSVDTRTIERCIENNRNELEGNGYTVLRGKALLQLKTELKKTSVTDIDVGNKTHKSLGIFDIRSFINIAMLLTESEKAKEMRRIILDIVIDVLNKKAGGSTKFINQRDEDFLLSLYEEENYRNKFTKALNSCILWTIASIQFLRIRFM
jgi:hypothetical protein